MAVNFSKLPPLEPMPENPPSRIVWTIVFFVIVIAGIFMVLLVWLFFDGTGNNRDLDLPLRK